MIWLEAAKSDTKRKPSGNKSKITEGTREVFNFKQH